MEGKLKTQNSSNFSFFKTKFLYFSRGAFSVVYKGINKKSKESFAIKQFNSLDENNLKLIEREYSIQKQLQHSGIVQVEEVYQTKNDVSLVLEL